MTRELPVVTIVVAAFNESSAIEACLSSIAAQDYPAEKLEVFVVDGGSTDGTANLARTELSRVAYLSSDVLENPRRSTPVSLNIGLSRASGSILCRVDARSLIPRDYVSRCVKVLTQTPVIVVTGGRQVAIGGDSRTSEGIARALRNPAVTGLSAYRRSRCSGPSDTVYLGAFRTEELRNAGGWDERLATNQDYELNRRLARRGTVWFDADLEVSYIPRRSLIALAQQYRRFGRWKAAVWLSGTVRPSARQLLLIVLPPMGVACLSCIGRRSRAAAAATAASGVLLVDAAAGESASVSVRAWGSVSSATIAMSWWLGVVEQVARFVLGERLVHPIRRVQP